MRDSGLDEAIRAAGGVGALARKIGIAQPSVSNWTRIPAERVIAIEAATAVDRAILRPDLFGSAGDADDIDAARAQEYALLATLMRRAPDAELLQRLAGLRGDDSVIGTAHAALAAAAGRVTAEAAEREFFDLFTGVGRGEFLPYGSYYLTGFLYERPLARLREQLAELGIARARDDNEPEDHVAFLLEIMAGLASRRLAAYAGAERALFEQHVAPWVGRLFNDVAGAEHAAFYRHVGALGRVFIDIETEAFALPS